MSLMFTPVDCTLAVQSATRWVVSFAAWIPLSVNWLDTGKGEGASVSVFRAKAGADESVHLAADYVKEHLSRFITQKPEVIEGPIKAHD